MQPYSKLLKLALVLTAMAAMLAYAGPTTNNPSVLLGWDRVTDPVVIGYRVYWGIVPRGYTNSITVNWPTNTTCAVTNLARGKTYYFAVTAFSSTLESDYSSEVSWTTSPLPPVPQTVTVQQQNP